MALTVGADHAGVWAAVECERPGCWAHVAVRPALADQTTYDLVCETFDLAVDEGWWLQGRTWCPRHSRWKRLRAARTVGEGHPWVHVVREPVKGA